MALLQLGIFLIGKLCIEVMPTSKLAFISETLCIGCGICTKVVFQSKLSLLYGFIYLCIIVSIDFHSMKDICSIS